MNTYNIYINNKKHETKQGERLIDVARKNHAHIGYFCGGNGLCQTCYVKVLEGMELLSPLSEREKALLSDTLVKEGHRVACLTTIEKPGTVKLRTTVEEVKTLFENDPGQLLYNYPAKMGRESFIKLGDTVSMQAKRFSEGKLDLIQLFKDVLGAVSDAIGLILTGLNDEKTLETASLGEEKNRLPNNMNRIENTCGCRLPKESERRKTLSTLKTTPPVSVN